MILGLEEVEFFFYSLQRVGYRELDLTTLWWRPLKTKMAIRKFVEISVEHKVNGGQRVRNTKKELTLHKSAFIAAQYTDVQLVRYQTISYIVIKCKNI